MIPFLAYPLCRNWNTNADPEHVALLCWETIQQDAAVLVFCGTKRGCVEEARRIARILDIPQRGRSGAAASDVPTTTAGEGDNRERMVAKLKEVHADDVLQYCVSRGVAWHNAGALSCLNTANTYTQQFACLFC